MLVDRSHRGWIWTTLLLGVVSAALYVPYHLQTPPPGPRGSTWPGLGYGAVSLALMLYAAVIGVRRKFRSWSLGRAETWLKGHIWLGLLAFLLVFLHAGFRLGGPLSLSLVMLYTLVVLSGIYGLGMQWAVPRIMTAQVQVETMIDQIPTMVGRLREEGEKVVSEVCGPLAPDQGDGDTKRKAKQAEPQEGSEPLKAFFLSEAGPYLLSGRGRLGDAGGREALFAQVRHMSGTTVHAAVERLEELCEERRQLDVQQRLHWWLHGWMYVHLPAAAALVLLSIVHAVVSVYY